MLEKPFRRPLRWADRISCDQDGTTLWVFGERDEIAKVDLMEAYETSEISPHVMFASSRSDEELVDFTNIYGPVIVSAADSCTPLPTDANTFWTAERRLDRATGVAEFCGACVGWEALRLERRFFAALLELIRIALLPEFKQALPYRRDRKPTNKRKNPENSRYSGGQAVDLNDLVEKVKTVVESTRSWELQHRNELRARKRAGYDLDARWSWGPTQQQLIYLSASHIEAYRDREIAGGDQEWFTLRPQHHLKTIVTTILNAFPTTLRWILEQVEELPAQDVLFGIRPVLIAMVRRDVLLKREVRICIRQGCGRYFQATRSDKACCTQKCREMVNNRRQYERLTRPKRQREAKKSAKKG